MLHPRPAGLDYNAATRKQMLPRIPLPNPLPKPKAPGPLIH
jgi:hypothetical protein